MIDISDAMLWTVIGLLGVGTFLLRFSFLGIIGGKQLPDWSLKLLRYVPVSVLPALVASQVTGGTHMQIEPDRIVAILVALIVGMVLRNLLASIAAGMSTLYLMSWLLG